MKKKFATLSLHRETLRLLGSSDLRRAAGGGTAVETACSMIEESCAICTAGGHTCFRICVFETDACY